MERAGIETVGCSSIGGRRAARAAKRVGAAVAMIAIVLGSAGCRAMRASSAGTTAAGTSTAPSATGTAASSDQACAEAARATEEPWRRYAADVSARRDTVGGSRELRDELTERSSFAASAVRMANEGAVRSQHNMAIFIRAALGAPPEPESTYYLAAREATVETLRACGIPLPPSLDELPPPARDQHPLIAHYYRGLHDWVRQNDRPALYRIDLNGTRGRPDDRLAFLAADAAFHGFARAALDEGAFRQAVERIEAAPTIRDRASAEAARRILDEEFERVGEASRPHQGTPSQRRIAGIADIVGACRHIVFSSAHGSPTATVRELRNVFVALRSMESRAGESEPFRTLMTRIAIDLLEALAGR
jgi:hypothetical protein